VDQTSESVSAGTERQLLVESLIPLAHHLSHRYGHWSLDQSDLFQTAMIAAITAVDEYRPAFGLALETYAVVCMRYELGLLIRRALRQCRSSRNAPDSIDPSSRGNTDDDYDSLWDAIDELPARGQSILIERYGLGGKPPNSQRKTAKRRKCRPGAIARSTARSIDSLRTALLE
jgi:RNA polymerase sigma factor (sigma-70 family)